LGNFGISAQPSIAGRLFADVRVNPSHFGADLQSVGQGFVQFCQGNNCTNDFDSLLDAEATWPVFRATYASGVSVNAFAPLSAIDSWPGFVPAVILEFMGSSAEDVTVCLSFQTSSSSLQPRGSSSDLASIGTIWVSAAGIDATTSADGAWLYANVTLTADSASGLIVLGQYDAGGLYAAQYTNMSALAAVVMQNASFLSEQHAAFVGSLPSLGDPVLDSYLRCTHLQTPLASRQSVVVCLC
jgi:hypothetical protein